MRNNNREACRDEWMSIMREAAGTSHHHTAVFKAGGGASAFFACPMCAHWLGTGAVLHALMSALRRTSNVVWPSLRATMFALQVLRDVVVPLPVKFALQV